MKTVDVQVQALYGSYRAEPYVHVQPLPGGATYDFYFDGQASYWSSTRTITTGSDVITQPTPEPTVTPTTEPKPIQTTPNPTAEPTQTPTANPIQPDVQIGAVLGIDWWQMATAALVVVVAVLAASLLVLSRKIPRK